MNRLRPSGKRLLPTFALATSVAIAGLPGGIAPAHAQFTVFDPSNYSQNVLTAARTLQQINNQIRMLQNQAQSLLNQAKNLSRISFPELQAITQTLQQIDQLMGQARGLQFRVSTLDQQFRALFPTGFNPLQLEDTPENRAFVYDLLSYIVRPKDEAEKLSPEQEKILARAVEQIFNVPIRERLFSDVVHLLRGGEVAGRDDLASRFEAWRDTRGWLFDNPIDLWDAERGVFGFDLTAVLDDPEIRTAVLGYVFFRIGQMLDGVRPMMLFVDEGWKLLGDDKAGAFINDQLKTIRKKNGIVGIGTQSARDITTSRIAHTLLEQSPTNIFFPNPKADHDSYVRGFGLSEVQFEWVKTASSTSRQFLVKHDHDSVIARLDLSAMPEFVKVLSGRAETVAECERLRQRFGDAPEQWLPYFCGWQQEPAGPAGMHL